MRKVWFDEAWDDYVSWQREDKKTLKRIAAFDPAEVQQVIWNVRDAVRKATELTEMLKSQV